MKAMANCMLAALLLTLPAMALASPPDECLKQIGIAIDNGDTAAFEQLVDLDQIMNSGLDMFIADAQKPENSSQLAPMLAILFSQAAGQGGQAIRNLLMQEAKSFVLNGVGSGAFAGKSFKGGASQGLLAPLFANASMGRKEVRGIGEPVADDEGWFMPFTVHDYGNDQDYAIVGRFEPAQGGARLVRIENIDQVFNQIKKEAAGG